MFLVPKFTLQNYTQIMWTAFQWVGSDWLPLADVIRLLFVPAFRERFAGVDARRLGTDLSVGDAETVLLWGKTVKLRGCIIAIKLLFPTLRCCEYFFWNVGQGTHTGVDIILPKSMPLPALQTGKVVRIKLWDGVTKNEGNCVVIQDERGYFRWYEHLETIVVQQGMRVTQWTTIGTCGNTGNSTQYHLHLQVDYPTTSPNPHRSAQIPTIQAKTIDPLAALRAAFSSIKDLPYSVVYQDAIGALLERGFIKWTGGFVFPEKWVQRYEMALMLHRILKKLGQYAQLTKVTTTLPAYSDLPWGDPELQEAVLWLWQYGLMKWSPNWLFAPYAPLLSEQILALLGRSFFWLQDATSWARYQPYLTYFQTHGYLVDMVRKMWIPVLRKEVFLVVWRVVKR